jgi:uncharacterized protein
MKRLASVLGVTSICVLFSGCALEQARRDYLVLNNKLPNSHMGTSKGHVFTRGVVRRSPPLEFISRIEIEAASGDADAESVLGQVYLMGHGVDKDVALGVRYTLSAAEGGSASAQHNIAWLYENGTGVEQSWELAILWYEKAAEQGYVGSINNLGRLYDYGYGVEKDLPKAFEYYKRAADGMSILAQHNLAVFYKLGLCVEKDIKQARVYYEAACLQGLSKSCKALELLDK